MAEIKIDPSFSRLIPPLARQEYADLEESVRNEGCHNALITWNGILLDGHNRYRICTEHGISYDTRELKLEGRDDAKLWIVKNQLARRNLTPEQMKYLRGERYNIEKGMQGGDKKSKGQNVPLANTAEKLAKEYGVSDRTIRRDAKFAAAVDQMPDDDRETVLAGKSGKNISAVVGYKMENNNVPDQEESTNLKKLKVYWKKATPTERKRFTIWANLTFI